MTYDTGMGLESGHHGEEYRASPFWAAASLVLILSNERFPGP